MIKYFCDKCEDEIEIKKMIELDVELLADINCTSTGNNKIHKEFCSDCYHSLMIAAINTFNGV